VSVTSLVARGMSVGHGEALVDLSQLFIHGPFLHFWPCVVGAVPLVGEPGLYLKTNGTVIR
jgi:hypothetical protein